MFWWIYFPVKSHLSLFIARHASFLIWCVSQSFSFIYTCPISLLSINLLLTNILNCLKLGLTFLFLLHPQNMSPHTEILFSSPLFYCSVLFPSIFLKFLFPRYSLCIMTDLFLFLFQWYSITHQCQLSEFCVEHCRVLGDNAYYW